MAVVLELERGRQKNQEFKIIPGYNFPDSRGCRRACLKTSQPEARRAKQARVLTLAHPHTLSGCSSATGRVTHLSALHMTRFSGPPWGRTILSTPLIIILAIQVSQNCCGIKSWDTKFECFHSDNFIFDSFIKPRIRGYERVCTVSEKPEKVFASVLFLLNSPGAPPLSKRTRRAASQLLCPVPVLLGPALWHRLTLSRLS